MDDKRFINEFFTIGFYDFFYGNNTSFERHIVECIADIYGKEHIKAYYEKKDENDFQSMIYQYRLKTTVYENVLRDMSKYEAFKKQSANNPALKTDIMSMIESNIITMFITKSLVVKPSEEEISHFENTLLNDFEMIKLHFNKSIDPNYTRQIWTKKKKLLNDNIELVEVKPEFLDAGIYTRFGININDVKNMDYRMVEELNRYVTAKLDMESSKDKKQKKNNTTVLSSGNGFVDAITIASIIVTGISSIIIYLFLHM